jgi:hypothetical protein
LPSAYYPVGSGSPSTESAALIKSHTGDPAVRLQGQP